MLLTYTLCDVYSSSRPEALNDHPGYIGVDVGPRKSISFMNVIDLYYYKHNPWSKPDPMRTAILDLGFAIQKGLSLQLRAANERRRARRHLAWFAGLRRRQYSQGGR